MSLKQDFDRYLKINALNFSLLKEMARSPLHFAHRNEHPREDSAALAKGRAIHTATLEPELFSKEYVVFAGERRQGKLWDAFKETYSDDYTILKQEEYDDAMYAAKAVRRHPVAGPLMKDCQFEQSFTWRDKVTGLKCKCRVDGIGTALFDLKSTTNADARLFGNLAARFQYHTQLAMYSDGSRHKGPVCIIAVEGTAPYDVAVFRLGDDELMIGRETYQGWLAAVLKCQESGTWTGRYPDMQALSLPRYVYGDEEDGGSYEVMEVA